MLGGHYNHQISSNNKLCGNIYGLRNAYQTFQCFIDSVLCGLNFCCAYVDDILIARKTEEEHIQHLGEAFRRLIEHGLVVNADKCCFGRDQVSFLGHVVNAQGVRPLQAKVKEVTDFPQPRTKRQLRRFLGMINFYRRFIVNCAEVTASLTPLTGGPNGPIETSNEQLAAAADESGFPTDSGLITTSDHTIFLRRFRRLRV